MSISFRQVAVSGSAAVALLGGAAAITTASAPTASAAETHAVAERAVTASVTLPDGRTMRITGMGGYGHQASTDHVATVASFSTDSTPNGITNGLTPDNGGAGSSLQNPYNQQPQTPAGYNQQITTQSSGGAIGVGIVTILILGIVVFYKVRHGGLKTGDAVLGGLLGIALSGTVVGAMGSQLTNSIVGSLGTMLGGLG
ncbi:hypothetical protein ACJ6WF_17045 [Streptomyces sp. MMS24-I2-30]|uniref:hypothetical protein n=1 Tax=Streptomyces sp. MMS24-I2-30 TaxID=3351564 RepID=UPI003896DA35